MALVDEMKAILAELTGTSVIVFADLSSMMILASAMRDRVPQEQLDAISRQAAASFATPLSAPDFGTVNEALIIGATGIKLFIRSQTDQSDALCLIGDHTVDGALATTRLRHLMDQLETQS
ncbi:MAG: hypothetical protein ACRC14_01180 [Paracoccaceae bacterium]